MIGIKFTKAQLNDAEQQIKKAILKKLNSRFNVIGKSFRQTFRVYVRKTIEETSVWQSLLGNSEQGLDAHFGIPRGTNQSRLEAIMSEWLNQIDVKTFKRGENFLIRLVAIESDWQKVSNMPEGKTVNNTRNFRGVLAWMDWLLNGNISLPANISNFNIKFDLEADQVRRSRSGKAIMELSVDDGYQLPYDLVGGEPTPNNNFVIRAFESTIQSYKKEISSDFKTAIRKSLK